LIIGHDPSNNTFNIQEITSVAPKISIRGYDNFKKEIVKWLESGLDEVSFVKCSPTNSHKIERTLIRDYVGIMDETDFENAINKIVESKKILK